VDHYRALGVARDASAADIRRAYLRLARRFHPDRQATIDVLDRDAAERRMREVNEAWSVLSDPARRSAYDRTLTGAAASPGAPPRPDVVHRPSSQFRPFFDSDEDDDDSWRYEPDPVASSARGRAVAVIPVSLLGIGFVALAVGLVVRADRIVAVALMCLLLAGVGFLMAPFLAMFTSRTAEQARTDARARRRSRGRGRARGRGRSGGPGSGPPRTRR
jgi:curved DNA-binding protein CbpA